MNSFPPSAKAYFLWTQVVQFCNEAICSPNLEQLFHRSKKTTGNLIMDRFIFLYKGMKEKEPGVQKEEGEEEEREGRG